MVDLGLREMAVSSPKMGPLKAAVLGNPGTKGLGVPKRWFPGSPKATVFALVQNDAFMTRTLGFGAPQNSSFTPQNVGRVAPRSGP